MNPTVERSFSLRTRREFLAYAAIAGGATLLGPAALDAFARDERVTQVMARTIGVDMHNHVYPTGTEPHPQHGPAPQREEPPQVPSLSLAEELRRSGLTAVCASFVLDFAHNEKPGNARDKYLAWLTAMDAELAKGHLQRALTLQDLQAAHKRGRPVIVQSVEGAQFIEGHLERIDEVYQRGVRHLQLLHQEDDLVSPLGDVIMTKPHLGGLTPFGAEVIKRCNHLGIVVDLAHASPQTVVAALKVTSQPVLVSHTGLDSRLGGDPRMAGIMKPHLISKEDAKVVAEAGGVVGVWTKLAGTPKEFAENLQAMVEAIGIDSVGIGTDTDLLSGRPGQGTNRVWPDLTAGFLPVVITAMLQQGFSSDEISKVCGGNFCRVFGKVTAGHA